MPETAKLTLELIPKTNLHLREEMLRHYSSPKGFVGRSICYSITMGGVRYGSIVGGSTPKHLPGRPFHIPLNQVVNNIFFHIEPREGYPCRNFASRCLRIFRETIAADWPLKYGDVVRRFESLIELPRTGEAYKRDGWKEVGMTKGFTCKRSAGKGTDSWTGKRVWDTRNLRPKRVFIFEVLDAST